MFPYWHSLYEIATLDFDFVCVWPAMVHPQELGLGAHWPWMSDGQRGRVPIEGQAGRDVQNRPWRGPFPVADRTGGWPCTSSPLFPPSTSQSSVSTFALFPSHRLGSGHWLWSTWAVLFTCPPYHSSYLGYLVKIPYLPSPRNKYILRECNQVRRGSWPFTNGAVVRIKQSFMLKHFGK